jgi:lipoyl(octanoyl) transferase
MQKNTSEFVIQDLGQISYKDAWEYQEKLFQDVIARKLEKEKFLEPGQNDSLNYLLFCEHPNVFTLGKSGKAENLLINKQQLEAKQVSFVKTNRGGDITFHGPGQIVCYPIFDLEKLGLGIHNYIEHLEETVILTIAEFGVKGERLPGATGVWIEPLITDRSRKICAIGVKASRWVTMHGLALNVNTDLSYFNLINPCGFIDKTVTSLAKETIQEQDIEKVKQILMLKFSEVFGIEFSNATFSWVQNAERNL